MATPLGVAATFGHLGKISALAQAAGSDYKALVCVFSIRRKRLEQHGDSRQRPSFHPIHQLAR